MPKLPDISRENNYKENFTNYFANYQFGRKQTVSSKRLQEGKITAHGPVVQGQRQDAPTKAVQREIKRLAQSAICISATAPDQSCTGQ
jgi:hypothetical protein